MSEFYRGKHILVTGGTGSIGSEIVRRLLEMEPAVLRIMSRDETRQFEFEQELGPRPNVRYLIGDIRDEKRLKRAMEGVQVVFHAAALKHVPSCEYNAFEAVRTNVEGTQNVINAALDAKVQKVIAISTDKAVNPINVMGATKLLSEKLIVTANNWIKDVRFACVRFGNVLGSRGSLVPTVKMQIEQGGPVTITHLKMTRFMMSIPEAIELCLEAGEKCEGGETFILRMPSLMIGDLIDALIECCAKACSRRPETIAVKEVGVRPGEKLDEELLTQEESVRTKALERMFVVYPPKRWADMDLPPSEIDPKLYRSGEAEWLDADGIRAMLKKANII